MRLDPLRPCTRTANLRGGIEARMVGQRAAIDAVAEIYQTYIAEMNPPGRPIGNFLFLGPTGTGKTRLVESVSDAMRSGMIKIDCAEFQHGHEIAKLVGSPPGYLGHRETRPMLSQERIDEQIPACILFDEIEKASDALWNLLLGILDKASLTTGDNRQVSFTRTLIFMTSNLGAGEMEAALSGNSCGFSRRPTETPRLDKIGMAAARSKFTPEFVNRIDKIVTFLPLTTGEIRQILDLELAAVQDRVPATRSFRFTLTEVAKRSLIDEGYDARYGARNLKRVIERRLVHPLSALISTSQVQRGDTILVDIDSTGALGFSRVRSRTEAA